MWIIEKDHTADPKVKAPSNMNAAGMMGPRDCKPETELANCTHRFRMYDDDGEIYYEGRSTEKDFAPLDDFGRPNAGAVWIEYWNSKKHEWEVL